MKNINYPVKELKSITNDKKEFYIKKIIKKN